MSPEIMLSIFIVFGLISNFKDVKQSILQYYRWCIYLVIVGLFIVCNFLCLPVITTKLIMGYVWINCYYTLASKLILTILTIVVLCLSCNKAQHGLSLTCMLEFPLVVGFALLFIFLLTSSYDFFGLYLAVEGLSLTLYTMGSMLHRSVVSIESSVKYYILGAVSTAIMLFGVSGLYAMVGALDFLSVQVFLGISGSLVDPLVLKCILLCILFGFFFKLSIFPCHIWIADIYEGVWAPVTAFYAIVVKVALILVFIRLLYNVMFSVMFSLQPVLQVVSLGSIILGGIGALKQVRIKRFIAYASINQVGFIMLAISCCSLAGIVTALVYLILYVVVTVNFFMIVLNVEHIITAQSIIYLSDLYGMSVYQPMVANHLVGLLLSMAGLPPWGGFLAKLILYFAVIEARLNLAILLCLLVSVITTYYYLSFIRHIFFERVRFTWFYIYKTNIGLSCLVNGLSFFILFFGLFLPYGYSVVAMLAINCMFPFCW